MCSPVEIMGANARFFAFLYLVQNTCIFYIGQEMMAVNKVFQPTGLTKLGLPK